MDENTRIQLKENYVLFQDGDCIGVYDKESKLLILRIKAGEDAFSISIQRELARPQKIAWLAHQDYWKWLGTIVKNYPDLFDVVGEEDVITKNEDNNYFSIVDRGNFAEKFHGNSQFMGSQIFLWGDTALNRALYRELQTNTDRIFIIKREGDMAEENCSYKLMEDLDYIMIDEKDVKDTIIRSIDVVLCDATGISVQNLLKWNAFITKKECVTLFYKNGLEQAVIGPLVVGGESACLSCLDQQDKLKKYYDRENGFLDSVNIHLLLFFILRILYYVKDDNLAYLLSDVQIPINKIITINKKNIMAKMEYIYREPACACNDLCS